MGNVKRRILMPKFMDVAPGGINNLVQFIAGVQRGKERRRKEDQQEKMKKIITGLGQQGGMDVTMKMDTEGNVSYSLKPGKAPKEPKPTEYGSPQQRNLRLGYGLEQPTSQELVPFAPRGVPYAGGGYVGTPPGRELTPDESFSNAVPLPEYAPRYFEEQFARPMKERHEVAGYRPKIAGFERPKEEKVVGSPEEIKGHTVIQKKTDKAELLKQYIHSISPNLDIQAFVKKHGPKDAANVIMRKLRKNKQDFISWIKQTYGDETLGALYPEEYIDYTKTPGT